MRCSRLISSMRAVAVERSATVSYLARLVRVASAARCALTAALLDRRTPAMVNMNPIRVKHKPTTLARSPQHAAQSCSCSISQRKHAYRVGAQCALSVANRGLASSRSVARRFQATARTSSRNTPTPISVHQPETELRNGTALLSGSEPSHGVRRHHCVGALGVCAAGRLRQGSGSPAHVLSPVSGRLRRTPGRSGLLSAVGEQKAKFGPRGAHGAATRDRGARRFAVVASRILRILTPPSARAGA